jgi:pSer/pThr/pTyr-binding forkhead associated (FHA) protein
MIMRDSQGKIVNQIENIRDARGNSVSTTTTYVNERPVVQQVTIRDGQGHIESRTILGGKLFP